MTIDTIKLRELAQKATPGPWLLWATEWNLYLVQSGREGDGSIVDIAYSRRNDIDYIAAANPATVLELLDALDDAHRNMDDFGLLADKKTSECRSLINLVNDIAEDLSIPEDSVDGMSIGDAIFRLKQIEAAARNLAKVKGRHHSELAMNQLLESLK